MTSKKKKKKGFQHACKQPTESTEAILGGARAFLFCCKHHHRFRKTKTNRNNKTYESNHNFFFFFLSFFLLQTTAIEIEPQGTLQRYTLQCSHNVGSFKTLQLATVGRDGNKSSKNHFCFHHFYFYLYINVFIHFFPPYCFRFDINVVPAI